MVLLSPGDQAMVGTGYGRGVNETLDGVPDAVSRAARYIRAHGGSFDQARLDALTKQAGELGPIVPPIAQNPDGGWPAPWSAGESSLEATCLLLDELSDLPENAASVDVPAAVIFLLDAQSPDGTWQEAPSDRTPERLMAGSGPARAYLTAHCARSLVPHFVAAEAVERAAQWLEWSLDPHGRLPGPLAAHWLTARVFRATGRDLAARRLLDVVGRSFEQLHADELAWFGSDTLAGDRWTHRVAGRLAVLQQDDGSWLDEDGEPSPALAVMACRVLLRG